MMKKIYNVCKLCIYIHTHIHIHICLSVYCKTARKTQGGTLLVQVQMLLARAVLGELWSDAVRRTCVLSYKTA